VKRSSRGRGRQRSRRADYRLKALERAASGSLPRRIDKREDLGYLVPCITELIKSGHLSGDWGPDFIETGERDGLPDGYFVDAVSHVEITTTGRDYLATLKQRTLRAKFKRVGTWVLIAIAGFLVRDGYDFVKTKLAHREPPLVVSVNWQTDGATVRLVNRGEPTVLSSIGLLYYANEGELRQGKPSGAAILRATGEPEVYGLDIYWSSYGRPMDMSNGEPCEASLRFRNSPGKELDRLRNGIVFVEARHTMSAEPVRKRLIIPGP
jgi:hypothetical protein